MDAKEQGIAKQEGVDKEEVSAKEEEAVEKPRTKPEKKVGYIQKFIISLMISCKKSWKIRLLLVSILSLLLCFYVYMRINQTVDFSSNDNWGANIGFASSKLVTGSEFDVPEEPNFQITYLDITLFDETTSIKEAVGYFFPPLQVLHFFRPNTRVLLYFEYERLMSWDEDFVIVVPWEIENSHVSVSEVGLEGKSQAFIDGSPTFEVESSKYHSYQKFAQNDDGMTTIVIPGEKINFYRGCLYVNFSIEGNVSIPITFSQRVIAPEVNQNILYGNPFFTNDGNEEINAWFFPVYPDRMMISLLSSNITPIWSATNSVIPEVGSVSLRWEIDAKEYQQYIEYEETNMKNFESTVTFFIGILLGTYLEVIINFLWERDETKR